MVHEISMVDQIVLVHPEKVLMKMRRIHTREEKHHEKTEGWFRLFWGGQHAA